MKKTEEPKKFCGNCHHHNTYEYPDVIFCFNQFQQGKKAIYSTLDRCEQWKLQSQECFCLRDALTTQHQKRK